MALAPAVAIVRTVACRRRGRRAHDRFQTAGEQATESHPATVSLGTRPAQVAKGFDLRVRPCTLDALARHHRGFDDELRTQSMDCRRALLGK